MTNNTEKRYVDFMAEISPSELYDRLVEYGMFAEKLPPVLSGESFLDYCKNTRQQPFEDCWHGYVTYENMRNINIPRNMGLPTPFGHERLCKCLSDHWTDLVNHFRTTTANQSHIVSRIHIRKMFETKALFDMGYKNWRVDGTPEPDIFLGKRYMVTADISKCYPSIYSHAIAWALAGKSIAKATAGDERLWYNKIDHYAQNTKNGETHGLLIGPHTSCVLSEIILCKIDEALVPKYRYIRNIDDYTCYVNTREEAEEFLVDLTRELREYGLLLNRKKTSIQELPIGVVEQWVHKIQGRTVQFEKNHPYVDYKEVQAFVDFCITLMSKNEDNSSILYYGLKALQGHQLTNNAKRYLITSMVSLAMIYPYFIPLLDEYVFTPYGASPTEILKFANMIYEAYLPKDNFEACAYALFFAIKANDRIDSFDVLTVIQKKDCILLLLALVYCRKRQYRSGAEELKKFAIKLRDSGEFDEYWLFAYETLGSGNLRDDWQAMKKANVSFLLPEYQ